MPVFLLLLGIASPRVHSIGDGDEPGGPAADSAAPAAAPAAVAPDPFAAAPWYEVTEGYRPGQAEAAADADREKLPAEQGDPAAPSSPEFSAPPARFSGAVSLEFASDALGARDTAITRTGLGGYTNRVSRRALGLGVRLQGLLAGGRVDYQVAYGPSWRRSRYVMTLEPGALRRDVVFSGNAGAEFDQGTTRRDTYRLQLGWSLSPRQRLELLIEGAPEATRGALRPLSRRISPDEEPLPVYIRGMPETIAAGGFRERGGFDTGGVPYTAAAAGMQGRRRETNASYALHYHAELPLGLSLDALLRAADAGSRETPDPSADRPLYDDLRRTQIYSAQVIAGVPPIVSPSQYYFGGLGLHDGGSGERLREAKLSLSGVGALFGRHEWKIGAEFVELHDRENPLYSGPRDGQGPEFYLYIQPRGSVIDPDSYARLRSGMVAQITCYRPPDPYAPDFISACNRLRYNAIGGLFSPAPPETRIGERNFFLQDDWVIGRITIGAGLRYTRAEIGGPVDFSLASSRTGRTLVGNDGFPVGTRDPDVPLNAPANPGQPAAPRYLSGPGRFGGGAYRFPAELDPRLALAWDLHGDGKTRLFARFARITERVPWEIAHHAFENEFGLSRVSFSNPDLTAQTTPATAFGSIATATLPGTRAGSHDDWLLGAATGLPGGLRLAGSLRQSRQRRILAMTQRNPMEAIINYFFDKLVYAGACQNCAPGQTSLFPDYAPGNTPAADNPASRGVLTQTLANPGDNTDPALFGHPARVITSARLELTLPASESRRWSAALQLEAARGRGNYEGFYEISNGYAPAEAFSMFSYPLSPLTRGQYEYGALPVTTPAAVSLRFSRPVPGIRGLTGSIRAAWRQGMLRTPRIASPLYNGQGEIPGASPVYYDLDTDLNFEPDRRVLRDYAPAPRGALGHGAGRTEVDLRLDYRMSPRHGSLELYLAVDNLLNHRPPLSYDDNVESPLGFSDPGAPGGDAGVQLHDPAQSDPLIRIPNPAFSRMTATQPPRQLRFGARYSF